MIIKDDEDLFSNYCPPFLTPFIVEAQVPDWVWSKSVGGASIEKSHTIELDKSGNVYIAGTYASENLTFGSDLIVNNGSYDVVLAKYDSLGNNIWAEGFGGSALDEAWDVITDNVNNVYITGYFYSSNFYIGSDTVLHNTGIASMFLVKYDSLGNYLWAMNSVGNGREWGRTLGVDEENNVYLGGNFIDGNISIGDTSFTNQGSFDIFLSKFSSTGQMLWSKHAGNSSLDLLRNIAVSPIYNNVYLFGDFSGSSISFDTLTLTNSNTYFRDNFIVKYDHNGQLKWGRKIGGSEDELGSFIAIDWKENIYVAGQFESSEANFDSYSLTNSTSGKEAYLAMYSKFGQVMWVKGLYGDGDDVVYSISSDMNNGLYVCGWTNSSALNIGSDWLSSNGGYDLFVSKFNFEGDYFWTKQVGNYSSEYAECLVSDEKGNLYVTGNFSSSSLDFDSHMITNLGSDDIFIGKLKVNDTNIGISSVERDRLPLFYPNPASEKIILDEYRKVKIFSLSGGLLYQGQIKEINISNLSVGLYVINIDGTNYRLIKE